ncbi:MAG: hypothetical protein JW991_00530 [Candidatus Pacebacteria bacterium]|nr:hypothetical protein [Candidatus Paceibacterota bacterium]
MKSLYFATSNKWKFAQAKGYFADKGIVLKQFEVDLPESRSEEVLEIAREKARAAFTKLKKPLFVIDGALHIKALNDFPKTYVKFIDKYLGAEGLLKLLEGEKNRNWEFVNLLFYKDRSQEKNFPGVLRGEVALKIRSQHNNFVRDFDRILFPEGKNKTYGEMSVEEVKKFNNEVWQPTVFDKFIKWFKNI